ncbi:MAG: hypothetical protein COA99_05905 [Moraxellaceae bacterium]|nr:MAG: hypothetical protein COA99_05905 [Moraxellaceae bacterium]
MKIIIRFFIFTLVCLIGTNAWSLAPEIEADRLVLAGKSKIEQGDFTAARAYLDRVEPLGIEPSNEFHWLLGQVLFHDGQYMEAKSRIEQYVKGGNKASEYYESALQLLTDIETQLMDREADVATKEKTEKFTKQWEETVSLSDKKKEESYDAQVKSLYLGDNITDSLVSYINSLFQSYIFIEGKVKNTRIANHLRYSLSTTSSGDILLTIKDVKVGKNKGATSINVDRLIAFGVNPAVQYRCSKATDSCTIIHPADGTDWVRLAKDDAGAKELAKAFGRLIKSIQRG